MLQFKNVDHYKAESLMNSANNLGMDILISGKLNKDSERYEYLVNVYEQSDDRAKNED